MIEIVNKGVLSPAGSHRVIGRYIKSLQRHFCVEIVDSEGFGTDAPRRSEKQEILAAGKDNLDPRFPFLRLFFPDHDEHHDWSQINFG